RLLRMVARASSEGLPESQNSEVRNHIPSSSCHRNRLTDQLLGYAIWIGNLPPHTDLMNLVDHVCKETPGLDSLFLISKSNCAFANFKDEQTCIAAQRKLHDSRFQTVRLVSRLRKNAV